MEIHITKKDVLWGYIAQFFNIGAGILLLPVILKLLPADILGVWYIFPVSYTHLTLPTIA